MGLLKNDDRRATPRAAAKKPPKPGRQPLHSIVPEPEAAAEGSVLDQLAGDAPARRRRDRGRKRVGIYVSGPTTEPVTDHASADAEEAAAEEEEIARAQREAAVRQRESTAFRRHLDVEPTLRPPIAPLPDPPDPASESARIERDLGIVELASSLEEYGTPPVAPPPPPPPDREAIERELLGEASADVPRWNVGARRSLRRAVREEASRQVETERARVAAEQQGMQRELDALWAELSSRRQRAADQLEKWVHEETQRRQAARAQQQAILDDEWRQQIDADEDTVVATLRAAVPDDVASVLWFLDGVAVLVVVCPDVDEVIADTEAALTTAGRKTMRARPEARRNDLYLSAVASSVLAAVGSALSATPAVEAVTCVAIRSCLSGDRAWEPIYVGTFERAYAEELRDEERWSAQPKALSEALEEAEDVDLERMGRTRQIAALDLSADPGLKAVVDHMDPDIRSAEKAPAGSDREAASALLNGKEPEHPARGESAVPGGVADVRPDRETDAPKSPDGTASSGETSARVSARGRSMGSKDGDGPSRGGDPLLDALRDSDGFVRQAAVEAIGRRNDPNDTPLLLEALSDRDDTVRLEAMYALKDRLSPDMRRDSLVRACADDDDDVRRKAIEAVAELADERDTPLLLEALKDRDDTVRLQAIYALKHRLTPDMHDALVKACSDSDKSVRRKALEALAELGDERDMPVLLKAMRDSDSSVRLEAIYALEGRSGTGPAAALGGPLSEAMKDTDATVRHAAVRLFGRLHQPAGNGPADKRSS